jgi:hypothetical protein
MLGSRITMARMKITSSDLDATSLRELKKSPMTGMRDAIGRPSRRPWKASIIRPPRIAVWPLPTLSTLSISRVCVTGMTLGRARSRFGFGSFTVSMMRVTVGRTFSVTMSPSLICGVTFMMNPTGTTFCVVVKLVTPGALLLMTVSALMVK